MKRQAIALVPALVALFLSAVFLRAARAEVGFRLWLRYDLVTDARLLEEYRNSITGIQGTGSAAANEELTRGLTGLLGRPINVLQGESSQIKDGTLVIGTPSSSGPISRLHWKDTLTRLGEEGFIIRTITLDGKNGIAIAANTTKGVLYGVFQFLRLLQTRQSLRHLSITSIPALDYRVLDHWDNLDRTVERGYAGFSLWDWWTLPRYKDQRYTDYARANASIGVNGTVINSVNANPLILTPDYLVKVAALADIFRPYGIRVYLSVNFSSPILLGGLKTADPLDPSVQEWWKKGGRDLPRDSRLRGLPREGQLRGATRAPELWPQSCRRRQSAG